MRLATRKNGQRDGQLVVVCADGKRSLAVSDIAPTLQAALDAWDSAEPLLQTASAHLNKHSNAGEVLDLAFLPQSCAPGTP